MLWISIALLFGENFKKYGYNFEERHSTISPEELNREIIAIKEKHPLIGEKMVMGFLRSK